MGGHRPCHIKNKHGHQGYPACWRIFTRWPITGAGPVEALDHDMCPKEKLVPGEIFEPVSGKSFLFFGNSNKTSDFMVDGLLLWWEERKQSLFHVEQLAINVDNGPECSGRRSQFLYRMSEFANSTGLVIRLIYYPPYHCKYNAIERYWAGLEKSRNGYLLDSVATVLNRARNFTWRGMQTIASLLDTVYEGGARFAAKKRMILKIVCCAPLICVGGIL